MSRYIDADELIFIGLDNPDDDHLFEFVPKEFIDNAPTADVVEVVRGEWIEDIAYYDDDGCPCIVTRCSNCGEAYPTYNYCPNCGADMRGGTE